MPQFTVSWGMTYDADDASDAIEQAVADLEHVVKNRSGPSIFVARQHDGFQFVYDLETQEEV